VDRCRVARVGGVGFAPTGVLRSLLISHRVRDHLFLRSRWTYHHR
jgi:hypothetical protein